MKSDILLSDTEKNRNAKVPGGKSALITLFFLSPIPIKKIKPNVRMTVIRFLIVLLKYA